MKTALAAVLALALLAVAAPAGAKPKPPVHKKPKPRHKPVPKGPSAADKAAAKRFVAVATAFGTVVDSTPDEQLPAVQADWDTCSASYPELTSDKLNDLEQLVSEEKALPLIAGEWESSLARWQAITTTNTTLRALVRLAVSEQPVVDGLTSLEAGAICDLAAQWKTQSYSDDGLDTLVEDWVDSAGIDVGVTDGVSAQVEKLEPKLRQLGVSVGGIDAISEFFL